MKIKLENIRQVKIPHEHVVDKLDTYCRECGINVTSTEIIDEYVCSSCRHIVRENDKYCAFCGESLAGDILKTEHYYSGKMNEEHFEAVKDLVLKQVK
jgi:predicted amidophosphoribosyltransferase